MSEYDDRQRPINVRYVSITPRGLELGGFSTPPRTIVDRDPGDESDWRAHSPRGVVTFYPRSWSYERAHTLPDHDGGDEDPWMPLSELSLRRLRNALGL